jgi:pimeloyl-ACP methyl ester carboxylesterase
MRSVMIRLVVILAAVLLLFSGAFVAWGSTPLGPLPEAEQALLSDAVVSVQQGRWLVFEPANRQADTGLIFYPGGRVDYRSYAPAARELASRGYRVIVVPMPLSLAVLGTNLASEVISAYPDIQVWAIGGHSLGGAMAALFAEQNPDAVQGLVLWAAYPAENNSLADSGLTVVSIYATEDGLATSGKIDASQSLLPPGTRYVAISGGNHAQFGWYGEQAGDGQASISPVQQQQQVVTATESLLQELKGN